MASINIHTLNARGNIFLSVVKESFKVSDQRMHLEIKALHEKCVQILKDKGIEYQTLKNCLIPQCKRKEVALIFDTKLIDSGWYGKDAMNQIIPLLDKNLSCSVLAGDYIENSIHARQVLGEQIKKNVSFSNQYYIVYINNLTDEMLDKIRNGLQYYSPFTALIDTTYETAFKIYLSNMLCHVFIKHKSIILQGHEEDRSHLEDINTIGYSFEENGLMCRSVPEPYHGVFLTYKIERPVFSGFEEDTSFSLNSVDPEPFDLNTCEIHIPEEKLQYLKSEKNKVFKNAGIDISLLTTDILSQKISEKMNNNYIYNLSFNEYDTKKEIKFNIVIEISEKFKVLCSLAYELENKKVRLITLF